MCCREKENKHWSRRTRSKGEQKKTKFDLWISGEVRGKVDKRFLYGM